MHALRGKEHVEYDNPYDVGMTGLIGFASGYEAMKECDTLLMLGTDFPYRQFYPEDAKVAQIDLRPEALGNRCPLDLGLIGDVKETLAALLPRLTAEGRPRAPRRVRSTHYRSRRAGPRRAGRERPGSEHRSTRSMSPGWSANWPPTTRSSPATSARRPSGRRAT